MLYAGNMQITININNDTDPVVSIDNLNIDAAPEADPIPRIVSAFPTRMDDAARRLLFASWREAFGDLPHNRERDARHRFTRTILGLTVMDDPSWSRGGALTNDQAFYMARVLNVIADILS
jgi:hypothetical protein